VSGGRLTPTGCWHLQLEKREKEYFEQLLEARE
jgi:hypothetical protein